MAYPALRTTKEDDNIDFNFLRRQLFTSDQAEALEREIFLLRSVRSAQNVFLRRKLLSRRKRKKETLNVLLLLEKRRIRNVQRTSKHFPTTKVDFLMNKVVLRTIRTMTVSRNATNDFRTKSENDWPTDLGLICNFPFSGGEEPKRYYKIPRKTPSVGYQ